MALGETVYQQRGTPPGVTGGERGWQLHHPTAQQGGAEGTDSLALLPSCPLSSCQHLPLAKPTSPWRPSPRSPLERRVHWSQWGWTCRPESTSVKATPSSQLFYSFNEVPKLIMHFILTCYRFLITALGAL